MAIPSMNTAALLERLRTMNPRRIVFVCNLALVIWVAAVAAGMTWRFLGGTAQEPVAVQPAPVPRPGGNGAAGGVERSLASMHLFGTRRPSAPDKPAAPARAPETKLKLSLRGVLSSDEPQGARAIIAGPGGEDEGYGIGDILPGNARLLEIHAEQIVLEHKGRREILKLEGGPEQAASARNMMTRRAARRQPPPRDDVAGLLREYRENLQHNPSELLKVVRPIPIRRGGKFIGFRLGLGRDRDALRRFDLEPGDIVTAINGVSLDEPSKGIQALRDLKSADMLSIEVERRGQKFSRAFQIP